MKDGAAIRFMRSELAGHSNLLTLGGWAVTFFGCMVIMELALEAASTHYKQLLGSSFTATVTLFQFGFCIALPMMMEGPRKILQHFPTTRSAVLPYIKLSLAVFGATALATHSLYYVSYPTKVVFKSAKLIPTMLVATVFDPSKKYGLADYVSAALVCTGAAGYSWGASSNDNGDVSTSFMGILLLSTSILCDAIVPNFQQALMAGQNLPLEDSRESTGRGLTAAELMVNVNSVGFLGLFVYMLLSGSLFSAVTRATPMLCVYLVTIGTALATAVFCYTKLIREAGSVVAVTVATLRKVATVVLSYIFFPKPLHGIHVLSGLLVLAGIVLNAYSRQLNRA